MRLELRQVVPVHYPILLYPLEHDDAAPTVTYRQQLTLLVECNGAQYILLGDVRGVWLPQGVQGEQIQGLHLMARKFLICLIVRHERHELALLLLLDLLATTTCGVGRLLLLLLGQRLRLLHF